MKYEIQDAPDFALLKIRFDQPGESIVAESGAMVSRSGALQMTTSMRGGLMAAAKRKLMGGESLFQNTFTSTAAGQELVLAPSVEGDVRAMQLGEGDSIFLQSGAYLAHIGNLQLDTKFGGVKGFFGGVGLFMLKVSGPGILFFNAYGALHEINVPADGYVCDNAHVVGFDPGLQYEVKKFGGFKGLFFSGEGLVCHFRGQGKVYLQTRNVGSLASFLEPFRPVKSKS